MPPRRSRASLPTPAASNKSESIASTPGTSSSVGNKRTTRRAASGTGLVTPVSLDDDDDDVEMEVVKVDPASTEDGTSQSSLEVSPTPPTRPTGRRVRSRQTLDSVQIPSMKRSKLGVEKTASSDNLTLETTRVTRTSKTTVDSASDPLDSLDGNDTVVKTERTEVVQDVFTLRDDMASSSPSRASRRTTRPAHQPFNVGKFSKVKKATAASLSLDVKTEETETKPTASRSASQKGKAQVSSRSQAKTKRDPDSGSEEGHTVEEKMDDFAMDSEEEEAQILRATRASKAAASGSTSVQSSSRGAGAARGKAGRKALNGRALRNAVAKAAQNRAKNEETDTPFSGEASTNEATPSDDAESEFELGSGESDLSDLSESEVSALESDLSDLDSEDITPKRGKASPRGKGKGKAAQGKGKGKKWGAGNRLGDGAKVEGNGLDTPDTNISDDDNDDPAMAKSVAGIDRIRLLAERRKHRKEHEEQMLPIRKAEKALKDKLGRKLTNGERNYIRLVRHHKELEDVWGDLAATVVPIKPVTMEAHPSLKLQLLPFQKESLYWMKKQEEGPWAGGMLADEMGMGKTIQTIALLLSEPRRKPSLVVAPVVALMQWKHEIEENTDNFTVCVWHGQGRMKAQELMKYDVVLSSYGTLEAAFRKQQRGFKRGDVFIKEKSPLHSLEWYRVILDEAHNIKERSTNAAKAAFALDAKYKWCLSGTPLQNRVGELYSLVRFLGADPFSHYFCKKCDCKSLFWQFKDKRHCDSCGHKPMDHVCFWNTEILTPIARYGIESGNPGHDAFKKLKILLDRMMLRRTKLERADDLGLPPRTIVVRRDYFSPEEKELYMSLFSGAKRQFATYVDQGTVLNNYSNIFSLITRMRQMACHPDLVLRSKTSSLVKGMQEGTVCRLCNDQAEDAIVSACKHVFDRECIRQYLEVQQLRGHRPECPVCHIEISIDLEAEAIDLEEQSGPKARQGILSRLDLDKWRSSTKLEALVEELHKLRNQDSTIKSLVFSQFVSFLDLIAFRLQRAGFTICRLEGGMTPQQRDATIQHFMKNANVSVFLISLKAGGVALNLTEASMVFMMDSWWNPSVEYQAMDRIHRLGQHRPVKVVKLVVEDSIEDQIVELQKKKLAMTEAALSKESDSALGKLTVEDLGFLFKM